MSNAAGETLINTTAIEEFTAYDNLPPEFRLMLQRATLPFSAIEVEQLLRQFGPSLSYNLTLSSIQEVQRAERERDIAAFQESST